MSSRCAPIVLGVVLAMVGAAKAQAPGPDQAQRDRERLIEGYRQAPTYQAKVIFTMREKEGRVTRTVSGDYAIALDRATGRFMLDRPEYLLVSDGTKLRLRMHQLPGWHVEMDAPPRLDYAALIGAMPALMDPVLPDLALLLADDPVVVLAGIDRAPTSGAVDAGGRRQLKIAVAHGGAWTLTIDPTQGIVSDATWRLEAADLGGAAGDEASFSYQISAQAPGQAIDPALFTFDTTLSQAVPTLRDLLSPQSRAAAAQRNQPVAPFALARLDGSEYRFADEKSRVVVLDFWATWCAPCRQGLAVLQSVRDWAAKEGKPLAVYAVNLQETPGEVRAFVEQTKLTLTVLMDADGKLARMFGVSAIPHTVIIADGRIAAVHVGLTDEQTFRNDIERIAGQLPEKPAAAPAQP